MRRKGCGWDPAMKLLKLITTSISSLALAAGLAQANVTEHILLNRATGETAEYIVVSLPKDQVPQEVFDAFNRGMEIDELEIVTPKLNAEYHRRES